MASCTQIEQLIQGYLDGELSASERLILKQHVEDCRECARLFHAQHRAAANLFETFSKHRLTRDLRNEILAKLPEMEHPAVDVAGINWRAKHPIRRAATFAHFVPVLAIVLLVVLAAIIQIHWPKPLGSENSIGVVVQSTEKVSRKVQDSPASVPVTSKSFINPNEEYETGPNDSLMLLLAGPTEIKLNHNTKVRLHNHRGITIERGEIWLDVGRDGNLFRVKTPDGDVVVYGTAFDVQVNGDKTTVTVERGKVEVRNEIQSVALLPGQEINMVTREKLAEPSPVNVEAVVGWTTPIKADKEAYNLFSKVIVPKTEAMEVPAYQVFVLQPLSDRAVNAINLEWLPDAHAKGHCGYDLEVMDAMMRPLFRTRINGSIFSDKREPSCTIKIPGDAIKSTGVLHIKLVPDFSTGTIETPFDVSAEVG